MVDASLPRSTSEVLRSAGIEATDVRDIGMRSATDAQIAAHARANSLSIITADFDFADIRHYAPDQNQGIVVIDRPDDAAIAEVLKMIEVFASEPSRLASMPGRLAIVGPRRIRIRPPLR